MQVSNKNIFEEEESSLISQLLFKYLPYWPLFLFLLLIAGAGAYFYLHYAVPVYETAATILVKDEKKGLDDNSNLMEQLNLFGSKKLVENEIEVIQSRTLMREVVKNLDLYAPITQEGRINSRPAYLTSPVIIQVRKPDSLIEQKKIYFTYDSATREVAIPGGKYPLGQWIKESYGDIRFIANPYYQVPDKPRPLFFSLRSVRAVTDELLNDLKVTQATKLSSVIDLKIRDAVPKRGEDILNGLIKEYNKAGVNDKNALAVNTLRFINERLGIVASELDSVEHGIQKYKTQEGIVDISAQGQLYLNNVGANDQKLSELNVQLAVLDQVEKYVQSKSNQAGIVPSTFGVDDPVLEDLLQKLYDLEVKYEGLSKTTAENNPLLISLRREIDKVKPSILENVESLRKNLTAGRGDLLNTSNSYASILRTLPAKERKLVEISRQQGIKNSIYSFLLQKREETALTFNSTIADTRIIDSAATTVKPVSPKPMLVWALAIVAALGLGAGLIGIREGLNQRIVFRSEIEKYTTVPVVGEIMYHPAEDHHLVVSPGQRTVIAEQFRQLRTSMAYIGINSRKKKILITSTISGEGKSFIAANLAMSLALTDKKVVLLELDLRKPRISQLFDVSREVGITNYFIGNKDADHIIKRTEVSNNLFIIPSGAIPPNPSELILNGKLDELLQYLDTIFDYILIDTAPLGPVTDAYILSPLCDATLYVVRHKVTPKGYIKMLDENIKIRGLKNLAIVFNGVKNRGMGGISYGYGYGYGKEYSYGYGEKKKSRKKDKVSK
ncbi:MAG TPA: polysaccharide biosynthesis tyrosine autokinase [Puia sp.]|jgi:capsular exopolysaccharide synthesis family protein|nr:polysaccharide biosynthesis tyrosine autokinase [Puia sp.]